jgi:precorrin-6x reductase
MMGMKDMKKMGKMGKKGGQVISAAVDWDTYLKKFEKVPREKLLSSIAGILLQGAEPVNEKVLGKYIDASSREAFIKTATIQLMSTPEYQLC